MNYKKTHQWDFSDGVRVSPSQVEKWHNESLDKLIGGADCYIIRSGNSMVIGRKDDDGNIRIYEVTNGYEVFEYELNNEPNVQASVATEDQSSNKAD